MRRYHGLNKEAWWYDHPYRRTPLAQELESLARVMATCNAWHLFFERFYRRLVRMKGYFQWFNENQYFRESYIDTELPAADLQKALRRMCRPGVKVEMPLRDCLFDSRAWVVLPLSAFVDIPEDGAPIVHFSARKTPWVVSQERFTLAHKIKDGKRFALLTFDHPQLHSRFEGKAYVTEDTFPRETTREDMMAKMMSAAVEKLTPYCVTIECPPSGQDKGAK